MSAFDKSSAVSSKTVMRIMAQFNKATKEYDEYIKYAIDPANVQHWYILISNIKGDNDEYSGGEFIFEINLKNDFPFTPPEFFALTANGLYDYKKRCCISIGEYHKNDYRAVLGVSGFARELANGLMNWKKIGHGINLITTTADEKRKLSKNSIEFNESVNPDILKLINNSYKEYSANWKK